MRTPRCSSRAARDGPLLSGLTREHFRNRLPPITGKGQRLRGRAAFPLL